MRTTTISEVARYTFFIPIEPMPAPRPRFVVRGRFASPYMPKEYTAWKDAVVEFVRRVQVDPPPPAGLLQGPLAVHINVRATRPRTSKLTHPSPDVDNYAKGVLDAITQSERWWEDDRQVVRLVVTKAWAPWAQDVGTEVTITPIPPQGDR